MGRLSCLCVFVIWSPWDLATVHTALSPQWGLESHSLKQKPNWTRLCISTGLSLPLPYVTLAFKHTLS